MGFLEYLKNFFSRSSEITDESQSYKQDLSDEEINYVKSLAEDVREEYDLNYSAESLKDLDRIVKDLEDIPKPPQQSKNIVHDIDRFSCYFGEVIRRNVDGQWFKADMGKHPGMQGLDFEVLCVRIEFENMNVGPNIADSSRECIEGEKSFYEKYQEETSPPL